MTRDDKKVKQEGKPAERTPTANMADRLVTIHGPRGPEKPPAWPPTFEEYAKVCDVRMTLF
jgi:hypothetical protein